MTTTTRQIGKHLVTVKLSDRVPARNDNKTGRPFHYLDLPDYSKLKKPQTGFGIYLPAVFEVEGLPCKIVFTLDQIEKGKIKHGITHAELICPNGIAEFSIPWQRLQSMAINSASFLVEHLPPNYEKWLTLNMRVQTGEKGGSIPQGQASLPSDIRNELVGSKQKFDGSKEDYKKIGELWRLAPHGKKHQSIALYFGFSEKWAHKHTAIGADLYPQFFKGYKQKTTKQKRSKQK